MLDYLTVSEVARELDGSFGRAVTPRRISDLFYKRRLRDDICPIIGGRRMIPRYYLDEIAETLLLLECNSNPKERPDHE
jgi:hypothetical protein